MKRYSEMTKAELLQEAEFLRRAFDRLRARELKLNMARGKPGAEQVELSKPMLDVLTSDSDCRAADGADCCNYGELKGIAEARELFAAYLGVTAAEIIVTGSSSLNYMYDTMARAMLTGVAGSEQPWSAYDKPKFLCPVPGYDRHFSICEFLGIEMINIPMNEQGPDMDLVEQLVLEDDRIKGIWCVPKYANPLGITYSDEVVLRLAGMKTKAADFRIFWDNAYAMHFIDSSRDTKLLNLLTECKKAGNPERAYMFGSTNKITFPGAGVAFFAASEANIAFTARQLSMQAIGWDKLNMLRHVRFLKSLEGIRSHMEKHAALLRPRFEIVTTHLQELAAVGAGTFVRPGGGYFVTYQAPRGCAKRIVALCREAGVILTDAGATHPYGRDPDDSYIRIAPTYPSGSELEQAMQVFGLAARMVVVEQLGY